MRARPVRLRGKVVGRIEDNVYVTYRHESQIYRRVPCRVHNSFCPGFAISTNLLERLWEMGARFVEIRVPERKTRYFTALYLFRKFGAPITDSRTLESQRALPLHYFVAEEYEPRGSG